MSGRILKVLFFLQGLDNFMRKKPEYGLACNAVANTPAGTQAACGGDEWQWGVEPSGCFISLCRTAWRR
jgi:hypothetical protein